MIPTAFLGFEVFHTIVGFLFFFFPFSFSPTNTYCVMMGLCSHYPLFLRTNTRMLWSGVFLPMSSHAFGGHGWHLAFRWKGRVSGVDEGGSVKGSPSLGAACLGYCLLHPLFRGRMFWKATTSGDSGRLFLFFCRLVVYCFICSYCGPLNSPRKVPANPTK